VVKAPVSDRAAAVLDFPRMKTMYGGKAIAPGDHVFIFGSENEGGTGLLAKGVVLGSDASPRISDAARQTPRVSIRVQILARATRPLGRGELRPFMDWRDNRPETELNFKFYRQATNKIGGISAQAATFLDGFF
jgi:hypothetical protein